MFRGLLIMSLLLALYFGDMVVEAAIRVKPIIAQNRASSQTMDDLEPETPPHWPETSTADYGLNSYYGGASGGGGETQEWNENDNHAINIMDHEDPSMMYYHYHPNYYHYPHHQPHFYGRRPRPKKTFLHHLQSTLSANAGRKLKSFQSALMALGVTAAADPTPATTPTPAIDTPPQPSSTTLELNTSSTTTPAPSNPAAQLIGQLAPTLSKLVDSVGNVVAGEGSLYSLKRDSILARLKYKKALFIGLPESIIMAKLNLPNTLVNGKKALLGVVSSLTAPKPAATTAPAMQMASPQPASPTTTDNVPTSPAPQITPETTSVDLNGQRLADQVSITYQDLDPSSSSSSYQVRYRPPSPPTRAFLSFQRPHYNPPFHYHQFRHPFSRRPRRLMYIFK